MRAAVVLCLLAVLATACQPFGGPRMAAPTPHTDDATGRPLGAPAVGQASTVEDLTTRGLLVAEEWQDQPVLSEIQVELDATGAWTSARLFYVAADAERMLQLDAAGAGFSQQQPSLGTLNIQPVPAEALDDVPPFPDDALAPGELVNAERTAECGVTGPVSVLYASGAPYAWDGTQWSRAPQWRATVTAPNGIGAALEVSTGDAVGECLRP